MSDEFKVQWTVSLPPVAQYAKGHMFNFRGETVDELNAIFDEVLASETLEKALNVASLLTAVDTVTQVTQNDSPAVQAVPDQQPSNVTAIKTCAHGKRTERSGTGARGAWTGYFCPLKKGDPNQCEVVWAD